MSDTEPTFPKLSAGNCSAIAHALDKDGEPGIDPGSLAAFLRKVGEQLTELAALREELPTLRQELDRLRRDNAVWRQIDDRSRRELVHTLGLMKDLVECDAYEGHPYDAARALNARKAVQDFVESFDQEP